MKRKLLVHAIPIMGSLLLLGGLSACSDEASSGNTPTGNASLTFSATNALHTSSLTAADMLWRMFMPRKAFAVDLGTDGGGNVVELTDFQISIRDIKFRREGEELSAIEEDVEFRGPFVIDLLDGNGIEVAQLLGQAEVPVGMYDGIRFVLHKSADTPAPLNDRTVFIQGTVDRGSGAEPFTMWHDVNENFDLFGSNGIFIDQDVLNELVVDIKLISVISAVDFTNAVLSGPISPDSADNADRTLADDLKNAIKTAADFGKDSDGDGILSETEDVD